MAITWELASLGAGVSVKSDKLDADISEVLDNAWVTRDGTVVPETQDISLTDGAVNLDATYVYADMANSTGLAQNATNKQTGKIIRSYLNAATQLLHQNGGEIRSFDGDRVMAIFVGDSKNSGAARAALQINWAVDEILRPKIKEKWPTLAWTYDHGVGIDTGKAMLVRGGVRRVDNDIVSIGSAPNVAAKLSEIRRAPDIYITQAVYSRLNKRSKYAKGVDMWGEFGTLACGGKNFKVRGTTYRCKP